ncbi:hypothetical protein AZH47_03440 [Corynebacterium striatum]|nr:hypothetical protein AZH47_03440 [Corynebacterium striatum]
MNSSRSEQRIDEFEVTGVRMMFENSIVCQCTFYYFVVIVIVLTGLGVWLVWCVPDRAFFDEGAIVNN